MSTKQTYQYYANVNGEEIKVRKATRDTYRYASIECNVYSKDYDRVFKELSTRFTTADKEYKYKTLNPNNTDINCYYGLKQILSENNYFGANLPTTLDAGYVIWINKTTYSDTEKVTYNGCTNRKAYYDYEIVTIAEAKDRAKAKADNFNAKVQKCIDNIVEVYIK